MGPDVRQLLDTILEEHVTPELITFSQEAPEEEWNTSQFLCVIAAGNPSPHVAPVLNNSVPGDILAEGREFDHSEK